MQEGSAAFNSVLFNLLNSTLGAAALSMPYFFKLAGVIPGLVLLSIGACLGAYTCSLLTTLGKTYRTESYFELGSSLFGPRVRIPLLWTLYFFCFGVICAYFVLLQDVIPEISDYFFGIDQDSWIMSPASVGGLLVIPVMLPLALLPLSVLAPFSVLSIIVEFLVVIIVAADFFHERIGDWRDDIEWIRFGVDTPYALSIAAFGFAIHFCILPVMATLRSRTPSRVNNLIRINNTIAFCAYSTIGLTGYFLHGSDTDGSIVNNAGQNWAYTCARVGIVLVCLLSSPIVLYPCRACLIAMLIGENANNKEFRNDAQESLLDVVSDVKEHDPFCENSECRGSNDRIVSSFSSISSTQADSVKKIVIAEPDNLRRTFIISATTIAACYLFSLSVPNVAVVFALTGSLASAILAYIIPAGGELVRIKRDFTGNKDDTLSLSDITLYLGAPSFGSQTKSRQTDLGYLHVSNSETDSLTSCFDDSYVEFPKGGLQQRSSSNSSSKSNNWVWTRRERLNFIIVLFGVFIFFVSTFAILYDTVTSDEADDE
eukprot:Rmarinus@m.14437